MKTRHLKRGFGSQASLLLPKQFHYCYKKLGCFKLTIWYVSLSLTCCLEVFKWWNLLDCFQHSFQEGSALPPLSCVNDASVLLEFVMSSVTCMEETESLKVFELVATWADAIANWDSWEEMEDQGVFNTIKEVVNFHQRFNLDGLFLKTHFVRCHSTRYSFCHGSVLIHAGHSSRSKVILWVHMWWGWSFFTPNTISLLYS